MFKYGYFAFVPLYNTSPIVIKQGKHDWQPKGILGLVSQRVHELITQLLKKIILILFRK